MSLYDDINKFFSYFCNRENEEDKKQKENTQYQEEFAKFTSDIRDTAKKEYKQLADMGNMACEKAKENPTLAAAAGTVVAAALYGVYKLVKR